MIVRICKIPALEFVEAKQNMGYRATWLLFDEPTRELARGFEFTCGKLELEGVLENLLILGILRKGAPVVKSRIVAVTRRACHMAGKIATEQRGPIDGRGTRGGLALGPQSMRVGHCDGGPKTEPGK
jgi:hypothetical protein